MIQIFLIIGIISIILSGMLLGVWTSGQQQRANYHSETKDGLIGLASLGLAGLLYYI